MTIEIKKQNQRICLRGKKKINGREWIPCAQPQSGKKSGWDKEEKYVWRRIKFILKINFPFT